MDNLHDLTAWEHEGVQVEYHEGYHDHYCIVQTTERPELYHKVIFDSRTPGVFFMGMFEASLTHAAIATHNASSLQEVKQYILEDITMDEREVEVRVVAQSVYNNDYHVEYR